MGIDGRSAIIKEQSFKDSKAANNIIANELATIAPLARFRTIASTHLCNASLQLVSYINSRMWIDRTNKIESPSVRLPGSDKLSN